MKARHWPIALDCAFAIAALLANIKAEKGQGWGIDAIYDYIDKVNVLVGDENGDFHLGMSTSRSNCRSSATDIHH